MSLTLSSSKFSTRRYQESLKQGILEAWKRGDRRVLCQLPTGGGKTVVMGQIASEFTCRGETALLVAHREELVTQGAEKTSAIAGCPAGIIKAGYKPDLSAPIQAASIQSLVNRLSALEAPALIMVDEAHHSPADSYRKALEAYPDAYILGVTATPTRLDGSGFDDLFDTLICGPQTQELIDQGYLSRFKLFADPDPISTKGVKVQAGDYSARGLGEANNAIELSGSLIRSYLEYANGKRMVTFTFDVAFSQAIAGQYNATGIPAIHLDGETPGDERREALKRFAAGEIKVLVNCALFDEGLDIPGIEAVQIAKPTKSLVKWLQMVGRALRPAEGKEYAIILDHTKNWQIHGLPNRPRIWTLQGIEEKQSFIVERKANGEVVERVVLPELVEAEDRRLQAIDTTQSPELLNSFAVYRELIETQQSKGYKPSWIYYKLVDLKPPLEVWQEYARLRGYAPGWAWYRYQDQMGGVA